MLINHKGKGSVWDASIFFWTLYISHMKKVRTVEPDPDHLGFYPAPRKGTIIEIKTLNIGP